MPHYDHSQGLRNRRRPPVYKPGELSMYDRSALYTETEEYCLEELELKRIEADKAKLKSGYENPALAAARQSQAIHPYSDANQSSLSLTQNLNCLPRAVPRSPALTRPISSSEDCVTRHFVGVNSTYDHELSRLVGGIEGGESTLHPSNAPTTMESLSNVYGSGPSESTFFTPAAPVQMSRIPVYEDSANLTRSSLHPPVVSGAVEVAGGTRMDTVSSSSSLSSSLNVLSTDAPAREMPAAKRSVQANSTYDHELSRLVGGIEGGESTLHPSNAPTTMEITTRSSPLPSSGSPAEEKPSVKSFIGMDTTFNHDLSKLVGGPEEESILLPPNDVTNAEIAELSALASRPTLRSCLRASSRFIVRGFKEGDSVILSPGNTMPFSVGDPLMASSRHQRRVTIVSPTAQDLYREPVFASSSSSSSSAPGQPDGSNSSALGGRRASITSRTSYYNEFEAFIEGFEKSNAETTIHTEAPTGFGEPEIPQILQRGCDRSTSVGPQPDVLGTPSPKRRRMNDNPDSIGINDTNDDIAEEDQQRALRVSAQERAMFPRFFAYPKGNIDVKEVSDRNLYSPAFRKLLSDTILSVLKSSLRFIMAAQSSCPALPEVPVSSKTVSPAPGSSPLPLLQLGGTTFQARHQLPLSRATPSQLLYVRERLLASPTFTTMSPRINFECEPTPPEPMSSNDTNNNMVASTTPEYSWADRTTLKVSSDVESGGWEFFVLTELRRRISDDAWVRFSLTKGNSFAFTDKAIVQMTCVPGPSLQDVLERPESVRVGEDLVAFFVVEMLKAAELLRRANIVHGRLICPENWRLRTPLNASVPASECNRDDSGLQLINFEFSVDLTLFNGPLLFAGSNPTSSSHGPLNGEGCFQVDTDAIAHLAHRLLTGEPPQFGTDAEGHSLFLPSKSLLSNEFFSFPWTDVFHGLMNPEDPIGHSAEALVELRGVLEANLAARRKASRNLINKQILKLVSSLSQPPE